MEITLNAAFFIAGMLLGRLLWSSLFKRLYSKKLNSDGHAYLSTACHHGFCKLCRIRCKYCDAMCGCACHAE